MRVYLTIAIYTYMSLPYFDHEAVILYAEQIGTSQSTNATEKGTDNCLNLKNTYPTADFHKQAKSATLITGRE